MKMKESILILIAIVGLSFSSCKKDDSTVKGNATYKTLLGTYVADGVTIYLMDPGTNKYYLKTTSDKDGHYEFYPVDDGTYYLEGDYSDDLLDYTGQSEDFSCEKDDVVTSDLLLQ